MCVLLIRSRRQVAPLITRLSWAAVIGHRRAGVDDPPLLAWFFCRSVKLTGPRRQARWLVRIKIFRPNGPWFLHRYRHSARWCRALIGEDDVIGTVRAVAALPNAAGDLTGALLPSLLNELAAGRGLVLMLAMPVMRGRALPGLPGSGPGPQHAAGTEPAVVADVG
jgi:hypothetical protein